MKTSLLFFPIFLLVLSINVACTKGGEKKQSSVLKDVFFQVLMTEPGDLHPIRSNELAKTQIVVQNLYYGSGVVESLLKRGLDTYKPVPNLAERWEVSKDRKEYTFYLRKGVKFHDGSMMTAEDVKFSFDAIFDDKFEAFVPRAFYSNFESPQIIDSHTVKFKVKKAYFLNLEFLGDLLILPKATYSKQSEKNRLAKTAMGSGPYKFKKWIKGKQLVLEKNSEWWGLKDPENSKLYPFKEYVFKFAKESSLRRAMLERGKADYEYQVRSEEFSKKMVGGNWGKTALKVKAENQVPKPLSFIGWNNKNKIFSDKRVRRAMSYLVDRQRLNKRFYYGLSDLATGPFRLQSLYANPEVKPILFNPDKAKEILAQAGWKDSDKDGVLDKVIDGVKTPLKFSFISANKDTEKMLTTIKEDMKKAGVNMVIDMMDWNAQVKAADERKFDAMIMAWGGGGVHPDPNQIWHSKSAKGTGSNYISYKNPEVDKLIEEGVATLDLEKRQKIYYKIHKLIAEDAPYTFLFEPKYQLYAVSKRVQRPRDTAKYSLGVMQWTLPAN